MDRPKALPKPPGRQSGTNRPRGQATKKTKIQTKEKLQHKQHGRLKKLQHK
jgi:hypothetical protein